MKTLNLNEYGVTELKASEMRQTDGGFLHLIIEGFLFLCAHNLNSDEQEWLDHRYDDLNFIGPPVAPDFYNETNWHVGL